ncbi:rho GTPase-activating protein 6-like [Rhipicephalus microplus]|uniref:rho GTPase-activating protein 6-like n=1 Tax=Rhipicephalus microplus TaxID=6941 RepID=UPI003F6CC4D2
MHQQQRHQQQQEQYSGCPSGKLSNALRKLWRLRAKSQSRVSTLSVCSWTPEDCCRWRSRTGDRLTLRPTMLVALTETEAIGFRALAVYRLQSIGIGCKVDVPRADIPCGQVFGVGLQQVVQSDRQRLPYSTLAQLAPWSPWDHGPDVAAADALFPRSDNSSKSFLSSLADFSKENSRKDSVEPPRHHSSTANAGDDDCLTVHGPQVPRIVNCCLRYLEDYGLNTVGIFRVNGSKRRVRQLREEFDSCREVNLDQERPHDVAQLLKEYLRDLPEPLLTRDLYQPFLYTQRVREKSKQLDMLRQLMRLLPTHSRDTLWALLKFLNIVAENSVDKKSSTREPLPGNRMDAHNLATMLGPNILRLSKTSEKNKFTVENEERAKEHSEVILVVRQLIENYEELFRVSAEDLDSLYRRLLVESPEHLEILLRRRFYSVHKSQDEDDSDHNLDSATAKDHEEEAEEQPQTVIMRSVTTVATHRGQERRSTTLSKQQDHPMPYILNTPEAPTSKCRGAKGDDDDEGNVDVGVSFTLTEPSVPNVPAYLTEATSESAAVARPLRKPTRESSPPSSATTEEEVTTIEAAPMPAARKSKGSSRRFLNSKEKEGKAARMNKRKLASFILSCFGSSSEWRRDSGDTSSQPPSRPVPRRGSREVRFQTEKVRHCEIISSEHTEKQHK